MSREVREIMEKYNSGEATLEETNEALKAFGIHVNPEKNPDGGWTEAEMAEGFFPGEPAKEVATLSDYQTRIPELAGRSIVVKVKEGTYEIRYNEDGYHDGSVRVKK